MTATATLTVTATVTTILRHTILLWVYFYLPVFRRSDCSGSIATATAIVTLHYVILLRVYFCLPALGERALLYETFVQ